MAWPQCECSMACPHKYLFFPHSPNQYVLSMPIYFHLRCYSRPVSHQRDRLVQHNILHRYRESVLLGSTPCANTPPTPPPRCLCPPWLGGGGWYLVPLTHPLLFCLCPYWWGGMVLIRPPLRTPDSVVVSVLIVKSNSPSRFHPECPP